MRSIKNLLIPFIILSIFASCSAKKDPVTGKTIRQETNVNKKVETADGIFFKNYGNKGTNFEFATSNILWRASVETLEFMPLVNANYSGGILTTDWYSGKNTNYEYIKINVRFLSNELNPNSISVSVFDKKCDENGLKCKISKNLSNDLSSKIKNKIIAKAKELNIENTSKKN
ncbi:DUF3576 domain-containing protein [Pelagibacteraceae bacterium]|nr:DUF3576 domain-containing protein [Pelagibacteraceae bacterium]